MSHSRRDWDTGRLAVHDRNFTDVSLLYGVDAVAPHGQTTRDTYTVPAGKRAVIAAALVSVQRATAPGSGIARFQADVIIFADEITTLLVAKLINNTQGAHTEMAMGLSVSLDEGTIVQLRTFDDSVDGTVDYLLSAHILEFDA
jgi:hypothetical protein